MLSLAFLTSCSTFYPEEDVHIDYQHQDSREISLRSVDLQGMSLTVTELALHNDKYLDVESSGKGYFFIVDYTLINHSDSIRSFDPDHLVLATETGDQYRVSDYSHKEFKKYTAPIEGILHEETVRSRVIFEMPVNTNPDILIVEGLRDGHDQAIDIPLPPQNDDRY